MPHATYLRANSERYKSQGIIVYNAVGFGCIMISLDPRKICNFYKLVLSSCVDQQYPGPTKHCPGLPKTAWQAQNNCLWK